MIERDLVDSTGDSKPFVSVIIPTLNEAKHIGECLESLSRQTYPKTRFEVLIVDGISADRTLDVVMSFVEKMDLHVLKNFKVKHVFAFNQGIKAAKGEYFVILGGHSSVEEDFLDKNVETFFEAKKRESKLAAVGGSLGVVWENSFAELVSLLFDSPFSGASSFWYSKNSHYAKTVAFGFYEKKVIEKIGCFDESMIKGQDYEMNLRLCKSGYELYYCPEIKSYYHARSSFPGFVKQAFDNGAAKGLCIRKRYFNPLWLVPLAFIAYQSLFLVGFLSQSPWLLVALFAVFVAYFVTSALFSLKASTRTVKSVALPLMFWLLHTITGIGFLAGLLFGKKVLNRNVQLTHCADKLTDMC